MAKLTFNPAPTFKAPVPVPVAGGESVPVELVFKHRTKAELEQFVKDRPGKTDEQSFRDMVSGWEFEEEFSEENVAKFLQNYIGAAMATFFVYIDELTKAKRGN